MSGPDLEDMLGALVLGRLTVAEAAPVLRQQIGSGALTREALDRALRSEAEPRIPPAIVDELIAALAGPTRIGDTSLSGEVQGTLLRTQITDRSNEPPAVHDPTIHGPLQHEPTLREPVEAKPPTPGSQPRQAAAGSTDIGEVGPGTVLKDRFELRASIGRGGMGMVFSALDRIRIEAHDPNPELAIKVLKTSLQQRPDAFILLQREASKAAMLAHPNIATVYDFDRDGPVFFFTMELLRGQSLDGVLRTQQGRGLGRAATLPLLRGIAEGLAYAHRKGIVHSDLKPANVFLVEDGTPKILDFGIARAVPVGGRQVQDRFDVGRLGAYTAAYATRDMIEGADPAPADDLYALGVIAYELLSGRHPFDGQSAVEASRNRLVPAPLRELRRHEWRTLARCLAFDRAARPVDAAAFLRRFFPSTRLRNALVVTTACLVLVSAYLWYRSYQQSGPEVPWDQLPPQDQSIINASFADAEKGWELYTQQHMAGALTNLLEDYATVYAHQRRNREAVRGLKRVADEMLRQWQGDPAQQKEFAQMLAARNEILATYPPVVRALNR